MYAGIILNLNESVRHLRVSFAWDTKFEWREVARSCYLFVHSSPNVFQLTGGEFVEIDQPMEVRRKKVHLVDAGLTFNSPYPAVLRPQRAIDLIISFDFSGRPKDDHQPFKVLFKFCSFAESAKSRFESRVPRWCRNDTGTREASFNCFKIVGRVSSFVFGLLFVATACAVRRIPSRDVSVRLIKDSVAARDIGRLLSEP